MTQPEASTVLVPTPNPPLMPGHPLTPILNCRTLSLPLSVPGLPVSHPLLDSCCILKGDVRGPTEGKHAHSREYSTRPVAVVDRRAGQVLHGAPLAASASSELACISLRGLRCREDCEPLMLMSETGWNDCTHGVTGMVRNTARRCSDGSRASGSNRVLGSVANQTPLVSNGHRGRAVLSSGRVVSALQGVVAALESVYEGHNNDSAISARCPHANGWWLGGGKGSTRDMFGKISPAVGGGGLITGVRDGSSLSSLAGSGHWAPHPKEQTHSSVVEQGPTCTAKESIMESAVPYSHVNSLMSVCDQACDSHPLTHTIQPGIGSARHGLGPVNDVSVRPAR
jgi:hypothetical protein